MITKYNWKPHPEGFKRMKSLSWCSKDTLSIMNLVAMLYRSSFEEIYPVIGKEYRDTKNLLLLSTI